MKRFLTLGGLTLCMDAERSLCPTPELAPFYANETRTPDITVHINWDWIHAKQPNTSPVGQDLIQIYYQEEDCYFCELDGGDRGALARVWYSPYDFSQMTCVINTVTCAVPQDTEGHILRMLPIREIFLHFDTLFLHASQISYRGRGILFSAPSGTGKSTQAKLWQKYRGAEIVCNDRTLLRKTDGLWRTYGYPLDGSEPVRSNEVNQLGCIVLLEQGTENCVQRLRPAKAISRLMQQAVMDCWSSTARTQTMELIIALLGEIPVYLLTCTPDERAVETLEEILLKDEVIPCGGNFRSTLE